MPRKATSSMRAYMGGGLMLNNRRKRSTILIMMTGLLPAFVCVALLGILSAQNGGMVINYLTMHLTKSRLGWNPNETQLTPDNIRDGGMVERWRNMNID